MSFKNWVRGQQARLGRQVELEHRAPARSVGRLDGAAVRLGYLADDRQPQTGSGKAAGGGRAVEAVEHVRQVRRVDPWSVVANGDGAVLDRDFDRTLRRDSI